MKSFEQMVNDVMVSVRKKHRPTNSVHEGYSIMLEEMDEVWDEVKMKTSRRNYKNLLKELVQVAASAQKMAEDVVIPKIKSSKPKSSK